MPILITRSHLLSKVKHGEVGVVEATKEKSKKNRYGVTTLLNLQKSLAITDLFVSKVTFSSCGKLYNV